METTATQIQLLTNLDAVNATIPGAWAQQLRNQAQERLDALGLPHPRLEAYRFTPVRDITKGNFQWPSQCGPVDIDTLNKHDLANIPKLVVVDGHFNAPLSQLEELPAGLHITDLSEAIQDPKPWLKAHLENEIIDDAFHAVNSSVIGGGLVLETDDDVNVGAIHILHAVSSSANSAHPRLIVRTGFGAKLTVIETFISASQQAHFTNVVTDFVPAPSSNTTFYVLPFENETALLVHNINARIDKDATLTGHTAMTDGKLIRNNFNIRLEGMGGHCSLNGLSLSRENQLHDNHINMHHKVPHCTSEQYFKGIYQDKSRGVFCGKVVVDIDAQQTDSQQQNRNLVLSDDARVDSMPQLEIYADDVKCAHGATTGQLDKDALFYLKARGLSHELAYELLIYGFAHELLERMEEGSVRTKIETILAERFNHVPGFGENA
jgi:Fe-S cluster assembly protein SufD